MSEDRMTILFVDDEQRILDGLRRQLHNRRDQWDIRFAISGEQALAMLAEKPADVVVSDMRMPRMSGGELLQAVLQRYPATIRIVLSGQADPTELVREIGPIHQYLQKPCNPETIWTAVNRTWTLAKLLNKPVLRNAVTRITALPPCSETYSALNREFHRPEPSIQTIGTIISRDPALTVKVMQLVNSAFFGTPRKTTNVHSAVVLLGLKTIHAIIVSGRIFDFIACSGANSAILTQLWNTSLALGECAGKLSRQGGGDTTVEQQARMAGVLALIGRAILITSDHDTYSTLQHKSKSQGKTMLECETEYFGATQDDVGAYALGLWGFADELIEAISFQSQPSRLDKAGTSHPVTYLHLARVICGAKPDQLDAGPPLDVNYIERIGLLHLLDKGARLVV